MMIRGTFENFQTLIEILQNMH